MFNVKVSKLMEKEESSNNTKGGSMKRLLVLAALAAGLVGLAMVAGAATDITNWCSSTYEITGQAVSLSGQDSAIIRVQGAPSIVVAKLAKNLRTGLESDYQINAISGDMVEFTISWYNAGEATADTVTLNDYVPGGLTFSSLVSDTIANGTKVSYTESSGFVQYIATGVAGIDPGPAGSGVFKFRATCN